MRCFRSFLNAIQSLNDSEEKALNDKQSNGEFDQLLSENKLNELNCRMKKVEKESLKDDNINKNCSNDLRRDESLKNCKKKKKANKANDLKKSTKSDFYSSASCFGLEQLNKCDNETKLNSNKILWIKNSLDPFPDFTSNTVLVVNRQYNKNFQKSNSRRNQNIY